MSEIKQPANRFVPASSGEVRSSGTEYGRPAAMPLPASEPSEGREPDKYGVALGDLIVGTDVARWVSRVGVVIEILPYIPFASMGGNHYRVRVGSLYSTGEPFLAIVHDHARVVVPAGEPVVCAACGGEHESGHRFIDCLIAHERAAREAAAEESEESEEAEAVSA